MKQGEPLPGADRVREVLRAGEAGRLVSMPDKEPPSDLPKKLTEAVAEAEELTAKIRDALGQAKGGTPPSKPS